MIETETSQLILLLRTFQIRALMLLKVCVVKYVDKFVCWSITYSTYSTVISDACCS